MSTTPTSGKPSRNAFVPPRPTSPALQQQSVEDSLKEAELRFEELRFEDLFTHADAQEDTFQSAVHEKTDDARANRQELRSSRAASPSIPIPIKASGPIVSPKGGVAYGSGKPKDNPFSRATTERLDGATSIAAPGNDPTNRIAALATQVVSRPAFVEPLPDRPVTPFSFDLDADYPAFRAPSSSKPPSSKKMTLHVPPARSPLAAALKSKQAPVMLSSAMAVKPPVTRTADDDYMEKLLDSVLMELQDTEEAAPLNFAAPKVLRSNAVQDSQTELLNILDIPYRFKVMNREGFQVVGSAKGAAQQLKTAKAVALGDLHGSYRKLMETLVTTGFVSMPADQATQFAELARHKINFAQSSDTLGVKDLSEHVDKLLALIPSMQWKGSADRKMILIGDVVNDRGTADQIPLGMVKHFTQDNPDRIIRIASNHDHDVLACITGWQGIKLHPNSANSRLNAFLIANAQGGEAKVNALTQDYYDYLRQSKLMHYEPGSKTLYTHAPVTAQHMRDLTEYLQDNKEHWELEVVKDYDDIQSSGDVSLFVAQANQFYQRYVEQVQKDGKLDPSVEAVLVGADKANGFLWSRASLSDEDELPFEGPVQRLVHGHDPDSDMSPFSLAPQNNGGYRVVNLDQNVRKDAYHIAQFSTDFPYQHWKFQQDALNRGDHQANLEPFYEDMLRYAYDAKKDDRNYQNLLYIED